MGPHDCIQHGLELLAEVLFKGVCGLQLRGGHLAAAEAVFTAGGDDIAAGVNDNDGLGLEALDGGGDEVDQPPHLALGKLGTGTQAQHDRRGSLRIVRIQRLLGQD